MPFKKGQPRPAKAGRKKGSPNKRSASVMEALTEAFEGMGGWETLMKWGQNNPKDFYPLWIKLLPSKIEAKTDNTNRNTFDSALAPLLQNPKAEELLAELANEMGKATEKPNGNSPGSPDPS